MRTSQLIDDASRQALARGDVRRAIRDQSDTSDYYYQPDTSRTPPSRAVQYREAPNLPLKASDSSVSPGSPRTARAAYHVASSAARATLKVAAAASFLPDALLLLPANDDCTSHAIADDNRASGAHRPSPYLAEQPRPNSRPTLEQSRVAKLQRQAMAQQKACLELRRRLERANCSHRQREAELELRVRTLEKELADKTLATRREQEKNRAGSLAGADPFQKLQLQLTQAVS